MELLINNTEQVQPHDKNETLFKLYGRRADGTERVAVTVHGFDPYFYAPEQEVREHENEILTHNCVEKFEYSDSFESLEGHDVAKIYPPYPQDTRDARELFDQHWEADVPFTNRLRIDTGLRAVAEFPEPEGAGNEIHCHWREIDPVEPDSSDANPGGNTSETPLQDVDPRVVTLDIEVDDRGDGFPGIGEERILSIVAHDSYVDETVAFLDANDVGPLDELPDGVDEMVNAENELDMLVLFREWFNAMDPDIVTGWNADDFDIPFIIKRMENFDGLDPGSLSPLGWAGVTRGGEPRIKGRTVYDLLTVYKKNSFTELRSYSLDDVAREELDAEKITFDGGYYDLYQNDPVKFIEYNARDVNLTVDIDKEAGVIEFRDVLRREVGVDFEDSYDNKDFVDMMCRRKLKERGVAGPTRPDYGDEPDSDYEGAFVFEPFEGVATNVVGIDLASLYPYTMAMLNASPETKVDQDGPIESLGEVAKAANGQHFRLDKDGLFKELVDEAISLKSEYKELRDSAETDEEYEVWSEKYNVAKTLTNSLYGVLGWERFFLYDADVAEAVTLTGQTVIKRTAEYVEAQGFDVIYGDTDSTYIKFPDELTRDECLETAFELCQELNETIYPELAGEHGIPPLDNLWEIEAEAYMDSFFQAGRKKRYAYKATWKDGRYIDDPAPSVSGFSSKRSDSAALTVETEEEVLNAILDGRSDEVSTIVYEAAKQIDIEDPDWEKIGIPGGMNKKVTGDPQEGEQDNYYAVSEEGKPQDAHPRAVYNSNHTLGTVFDQGSKPMRAYLKPKFFEEVGRQVEVIAYEEARDVEPISDTITLDAQRMTQTLLVNPLEEILAAVGVDASAAIRGQEQTGLGAFK